MFTNRSLCGGESNFSEKTLQWQVKGETVKGQVKGQIHLLASGY